MRRLPLLLLLSLCVLLPAGPASAADANLPPPDPPGTWRHLTRDDATTTSRCVGDPRTPLCAVETFRACFLRRRPDYCDMVEAGVRPLADVTRPMDEREDYRVVYARRPSPLDPVERSTEGPLQPLPGDVIVAIMLRTCWGAVDDESGCETNVEKQPLYIYMLRKQGGIWTNPYFFRPRF